MKPFDLQAAMRGADVVTRDGRKVDVVQCRLRGDFPVLAVIHNDDHDVARTFTESGHHINDDNSSGVDLFMVAVKREGWINLFKGDDGCVYTSATVCDTEEIAKRNNQPFGLFARNRNVTLEYISSAKVNWEE